MAHTKLYIGNLPYRLRKQQFIDFFADCGDITDACIIKDKNTNRSKGFGFITFANESDMQSALSLDGVELEGRPLKINFANDKESDAFDATQQRGDANRAQATNQRQKPAANSSSGEKVSGVESRSRMVDIVIGSAIGLVAGLLICQLL